MGATTLKNEITQACKTVRHSQKTVGAQKQVIKLSNNWSVLVEPIAAGHLGNPRVAWKNYYFLINPAGQSFGGYDIAETFVGWATRFAQEQSQ